MEIVVTLEHPTLPGLWVSSDGQVYIPATPHHPAHWTFGTDRGDGYRKFGFKNKRYYIHRIVAETFIPNPDNKPYIDHIDRNPSNNNVENLRWVTVSENNYNSRRNRPVGSQLKDFDTKSEYQNNKYKTDEEYRNNIKAKLNERYKNDPIFREQQKSRYKNNPDYRKHMLEHKQLKRDLTSHKD